MPAKISDLSNELVKLISDVERFSDKTFYVFNNDELAANQRYGGFPIVAVSYFGSNPKEGNQGDPVAKEFSAVRLMTVSFMIVVAIDYDYGEGNSDRKDYATDILDDIKNAVLGYQGVNNRPWLLVGESPMDPETEGVIWYSQLWETTVVVKRTTTN